jgi:prepilin-type N-terminal cleavage/methylation domain-containing protein
MNLLPAMRGHSPAVGRLRARRGFTIPEVALAVIVLSLAIGTALIVLQRGFLALDTARNLHFAANIMQCQFERERLMPWAQVSSSTYEPAIDPSFLRNPSIAGRFTLSRAVTFVPQRSEQMVQVTLTVTWRSYDGRQLSRSYTTYFCNGGLYNYIYQNT